MKESVTVSSIQASSFVAVTYSAGVSAGLLKNNKNIRMNMTAGDLGFSRWRLYNFLGYDSIYSQKPLFKFSHTYAASFFRV
jgi:hypothetical protein